MAYDYALLSNPEAQRAIKLAGADKPPIDDINDALWAASEEIQNVLGRPIIQKTWVEYHRRSRTEPTILRVLHWPISSITEIAEDADRDYGATTVLTADTDYQIIHEDTTSSLDSASKIVRISNDSPTAWDSGFEAIRITFVGGWTLANVPYPIRRVCSEYMARQYHARSEQSYAFKSVSNELGTVQSFGPVMLTKPQIATLSAYRDYGATTCTRWTTS
jgi:hypothetical protein